jgi:hypothetical protein
MPTMMPPNRISANASPAYGSHHSPLREFLTYGVLSKDITQTMVERQPFFLGNDLVFLEHKIIARLNFRPEKACSLS